MKRVLIIAGLLSVIGTANAEGNEQTQATLLNASEFLPESVQILSDEEMQDTKAGAIYLRHESIKGNVTAEGYEK